jgi:hypothetical protein
VIAHSPAAVVVNHAVVGNAKKPGQERFLSTGAAGADGLYHFQEDIVGEVLGLLDTADPIIDIAIDISVVELAKFGQRLRLVALSSLNKG